MEEVILLCIKISQSSKLTLPPQVLPKTKANYNTITHLHLHLLIIITTVMVILLQVLHIIIVMSIITLEGLPHVLLRVLLQEMDQDITEAGVLFLTYF
jgi:hypothetical protein